MFVVVTELFTVEGTCKIRILAHWSSPMKTINCGDLLVVVESSAGASIFGKH